MFVGKQDAQLLAGDTLALQTLPHWAGHQEGVQASTVEEEDVLHLTWLTAPALGMGGYVTYWVVLGRPERIRAVWL